jgi:hypothetical protein
MASLPFLRHCLCCSHRFTRAAPGETLDSRLPGSDDGGAQHRYPSCGHLFWSRCRLEWCCSGGNYRSRFARSDDGDTRCRSFLWGIILEQSLARGGYEVERCVPYRIDYSWSWWRATAEARWRLHFVLRVQGGRTIWRHGGVDGEPGRSFTLV